MSHFTIPIVVNDHNATIDGWLDANDDARLSVREGHKLLPDCHFWTFDPSWDANAPATAKAP